MSQRNFQWQKDENKWTKIIIPSGTVDPGQSTIIQIPDDLQHNEVIIARNPLSAAAQSGAGNGNDQQLRPCPAGSPNQDTTVGGNFGASPPLAQSTTASRPRGAAPPPPSPQAAAAPPGNGECEDNMIELTTEKEAEIINKIRECDRQRERLFIMPINKKMRLMEQMEYIETGVVRKDLKEFQETRRKLVFDLQSILSTLPNVKKPVRGIAAKEWTNKG